SLLDELLNSTSPDDGPDDTPPGGAPPEGGDGPSPPSGDGAEHSDAPDAARPGDAPSGDGEATESEAPGGAGEAEAGKVAAAAAPHAVPLLKVPGVGEGAAGRRSRSRTALGKVTGTRRPAGRIRDAHVIATLLAAGRAGGRSRSRTALGKGTGSRRPAGRLRGRHVIATLLAAAPHQRARGRSGPGLVLRPDDLRESVREGREGNLVLFVVDASGS